VPLPNPDRAVVEAAKVRDYLLSTEHPVGRFKAAVFASAGYDRDRWTVLQADLLETALLEPTVEAGTAFGQKFEVLAILRGARRELAVTVIWLVRRGEDFPRLVTAYPRSRP
jgi:uncharacterized protein DUF6883